MGGTDDRQISKGSGRVGGRGTMIKNRCERKLGK